MFPVLEGKSEERTILFKCITVQGGTQSCCFDQSRWLCWEGWRALPGRRRMWQCYGGSFDVFWPCSKGHVPATCTAGTGSKGCSQAHTSALCSAAVLQGHALGPAHLSLEFPCSFSLWFLCLFALTHVHCFPLESIMK